MGTVPLLRYNTPRWSFWCIVHPPYTPISPYPPTSPKTLTHTTNHAEHHHLILIIKHNIYSIASNIQCKCNFLTTDTERRQRGRGWCPTSGRCLCWPAPPFYSVAWPRPLAPFISLRRRWLCGGRRMVGATYRVLVWVAGVPWKWDGGDVGGGV